MRNDSDIDPAIIKAIVVILVWFEDKDLTRFDIYKQKRLLGLLKKDFG